MFRDFLDTLHRNGLLVDLIAIKLLINCIVVSIFMMIYRGATGTKLGDVLQFLSSILIISVMSYCSVEFFHWNLYVTPTLFGFFGDVIVSKVVAKGFRENFVVVMFNFMLSKISFIAKIYKESVISNKERLDQEKKSNNVITNSKEESSDAEKEEQTDEIKRRLQRKHRTNRH